MSRWWRAGVAALIAVGVLLPLAPLLIWSFADRWFFPALLPAGWTLATWQYVLSPSARVGEALLTSTSIALMVVVLCVALGLPAARTLGLYTFRGKALIEWLLMAPIIVPGLVVVMGVHIALIRTGLADTMAGVVLVHLAPALPYFVLVMTGVFANYSTELEETARTLGASPQRVFLHVTLPTILPSLSVAAMFTFLVSWTQYITTVLVGGGQIVTLPMVLFPLIGAANHAVAAAVSLVFMAPALLILILTTRFVHNDIRTLGGIGKL